MGIGIKIGIDLGATAGVGPVFVPGVLTASKRTFVLAGQGVNFLRDDVLVAGVGAFALAGQDVSFATPADALGADAGVFVLAGQNATLTPSGSSGPGARFNAASSSMYLVVIDDF